MAINVNDDNFKSEVLEADIPVLVDFWAEWCMPCRMVAPTIDEIAREKEGSVKVCKLNVDESPDTARQYSVMSIPTIAYFNGGKLIDKVVGAQSKSAILSLLSS